MTTSDNTESGREWLLGLLPDWLGSIISIMPNWFLISLVLLAIFVVIGLRLNKFFESYTNVGKGYKNLWRVLRGKSIKTPAPVTPNDLEKFKAELLQTLTAQNNGTPVDVETQAARKDAVDDLIEDTTPAATEAVRDFTAGDVQEGFDALEQQARAAEADAAKKWRRLGALASGVDTTRARKAYEEAFKLQPDDFTTCVMLTRLRMQAGDLNAAKKSAMAAVAVAVSMREKSIADSGYGDVLVVAGELTGATKRYEEVLQNMRHLADDNPGNAEAQRDLSISLEKLGNVLVKAEDIAVASKCFEEVLQIRERLAKDNPGSAEARRDLSLSLTNLGDVLVKAGEFAGATKRYEKSLQIAKCLADDNPGGAEVQRDLSTNLERLGYVLVEADDLAGAKRRFDEALKIRERLADDNPGSAQAQRDLIVSYVKLSEVAPGQGWPSKALVICETLVAEGRLAPADAWMLEELRKYVAEDQ